MPATLLAIDTATEVCSVALACGEQVVEVAEPVGQKHSARVLPMIHELLRAQGLVLADCDAIAFGAGPGAFTGLRIACGIAQGLAFGAVKPVLPVGNLAALALAAQTAKPGSKRILAAIDARMQEVYWALYATAPQLEELTAPALATAAELAALCRLHGPDLVAGDALLAFPQQAAQLDCALAPDLRASAAGIARLARRRFGQGAAMPPEQAAPLYVRDRVARTIGERRADGAVP